MAARPTARALALQQRRPARPAPFFAIPRAHLALSPPLAGSRWHLEGELASIAGTTTIGPRQMLDSGSLRGRPASHAGSMAIGGLRVAASRVSMVVALVVLAGLRDCVTARKLVDCK
jgi:hypothetical protein